MQTIDLRSALLLARYHELPMKVVARHEAGHAVMAHARGGWVKRIVLGRKRDNAPFARAFFAVPDKHAFVAVLSSGVLAMFLHSRPDEFSFDAFKDWLETHDGEVQVLSATSDWMQILAMTGQGPAAGRTDLLERAVRPYFDETVALLVESTEVVDRLTEFLLSSPAGIGRREMKRFFAGSTRGTVARLLDRPSVLWSAFLERRSD